MRLKVTAHLNSVTYPEAAALGIDDLEHGFFVNTQLDPGANSSCSSRPASRPSRRSGSATYNGALFLGRLDRTGSIEPGKNADLVLVKGDPSARIEDVENVELVFKDGVGYDPGKLIDSVRVRYGQYLARRRSRSRERRRDVERGGHAVGDRQSGHGRRQPPATAPGRRARRGGPRPRGASTSASFAASRSTP